MRVAVLVGLFGGSDAASLMFFDKGAGSYRGVVLERRGCGYGIVGRV